MGYVQETQLRAFPKEFIHPTQWQSDQLPECSDGASSLTSASLSVSEHHLDTPSGTDPTSQPLPSETHITRSWRTREQPMPRHRCIEEVDGSTVSFEGNDGCLESWMFGEPRRG